jgi:putative endonuclease
MKYFVYILFSEKSNIYYKGFSETPFERLVEHNENKSRFTSGKGPWKMVYLEGFEGKSQALIREKMLKRQNRKYIDWLINQPINGLMNM